MSKKAVECFNKHTKTRIEVKVEASEVNAGKYFVDGLRDAIATKEKFDGAPSTIKIFGCTPGKTPPECRDELPEGELPAGSFFFELTKVPFASVERVQEKWHRVVGTLKNWRQYFAYRRRTFEIADELGAVRDVTLGITHTDFDVHVNLIFETKDRALSFRQRLHHEVSFQKMSVLQSLELVEIEPHKEVFPVRILDYERLDTSPPETVYGTSTRERIEDRKEELTSFQCVDEGVPLEMCHILPNAMFSKDTQKFHPASILLVGSKAFNDAFDGSFKGARYPHVSITIESIGSTFPWGDSHRVVVNIKVNYSNVPSTVAITPRHDARHDIPNKFYIVAVSVDNLDLFKEAISWREQARLKAIESCKGSEPTNTNDREGRGWWRQVALPQKLRDCIDFVNAMKIKKKRVKEEEGKV